MSYNYKAQTQEEDLERFNLFGDINTLFNNYFAFYPYIERPTNNKKKFPNHILKEFLDEFKYGNMAECTNSILKNLWLQFMKQYQKSVVEYQQAAQKAQEQRLFLFMQQQQQQQMLLQEQGIPSNAYGYQQNYPPQNYQQQNYQQNYQQQNYQQNYQQQNYQQQNYQQGNQAYQSNFNQQNFQGHHQNSNFQGNPNYQKRPHYQKDQNSNFQHHRGQNGNYKQHNQNYKENRHAKGHTYHQKHSYHTEEPITQPEELIQPDPVPVEVPKVPEVPKYVPVQKKFSIEQIKKLINSATKEQLEKVVDPKLMEKATEISSWKVQEVDVELKEEKQKDNKNKQNNSNKNNPNIKTGTKISEAKQAENLGYKPQQKIVQIRTGVNETLEARFIKQEIKNKAGQDFLTMKEKEYETLDQVEKARKEIVYNLNLIAPENLKDIEKNLIPFLFEDPDVCKSMVIEIIKKAWDQPKYASTYATLCSDFSKKAPASFKFDLGNKEEAKEKKGNSFKFFLIERVQHSFDEKIQKFPEFQTPEDKEEFLKEKKKQILSNVKFIAELIICKVLKKRIMKYCISQLFESFLRHYSNYSQTKQLEDSIYDYHFEAIIEFIECVGEKYEQVDEKDKPKEGEENKVAKSYFEEILQHIQNILGNKQVPDFKLLLNLQNLSGDEYFNLLNSMNDIFIRKNFPRLGALLQNLVERRKNRWQKHLSVADGPKKLKQIQEEINREEEDLEKNKAGKEKQEQQKLDKKVKEMFEGWQMNKNEEEREMKEIFKKFAEDKFYLSFLKQVADEKKDNVGKRVLLFDKLLNHERFQIKVFRNAWFDVVRYLAIGAGDYPFCGAAFAKILRAVVQKEGNFNDYFKKFEDEDEQFFMEEIIQKYYHYSQDPEALKIIGKAKRVSGLI